ncbi:hypothetical protein A6U96_02585 [Agrobacterium tumefaciens]|nr:hypothetical protein A6U96_02585 [Agrobacterium tumefaciens]
MQREMAHRSHAFDSRNIFTSGVILKIYSYFTEVYFEFQYFEIKIRYVARWYLKKKYRRDFVEKIFENGLLMGIFILFSERAAAFRRPFRH